jgi:hypothetical protein
MSCRFVQLHGRAQGPRMGFHTFVTDVEDSTRVRRAASVVVSCDITYKGLTKQPCAHTKL